MAQTLLGIAFETVDEATAALERARQLEAIGLVRVHDAATITWDTHGRPSGLPAAFALEEGTLMELAKPGQVVLALHVTDLAGMVVIEELRGFRNTRVLYV